jgi:hypothetical protein
MKSFLLRLVAFFLLSLCISDNVLAQEKKIKVLFGPRAGITYVAADPDSFTTSVNDIYHTNNDYFPLFSEIGLSVQQHIRISTTESYFTFQELLLIGGLDQNIVLPSISLLLGYVSPFGLNVGLGPYLTLQGSEGKAGIAASMVFKAGWTFRIHDVALPVSFTIVPLPGNDMPILKLLTGLDFNFSD